MPTRASAWHPTQFGEIIRYVSSHPEIRYDAAIDSAGFALCAYRFRSVPMVRHARFCRGPGHNRLRPETAGENDPALEPGGASQGDIPHAVP